MPGSKGPQTLAAWDCRIRPAVQARARQRSPGFIT
jgi:hypothetical protein